MPMPVQGWGYRLISSFPLFFHFFQIIKHGLPNEYHVHIWLVSPQLSCQLWMGFNGPNKYFGESWNFFIGEINGRGFSNPHPRRVSEASKQSNNPCIIFYHPYLQGGIQPHIWWFVSIHQRSWSEQFRPEIFLRMIRNAHNTWKEIQFNEKCSWLFFRTGGILCTHARKYIVYVFYS